MDNFDILKEFAKAEEIPEVVEKKWQDGKTAVLFESIKREKKKNNVWPFILKSAGSVAAVFALMITIGYYNPAFAENVPFIEDIVSFFKTGAAGYVDPIITNTDVEDRLEPPVVETSDDLEGSVDYAEETGFTVNEVYADGNVLVFSYTVDATLDTKDYDSVSADGKVYINGQVVSQYGSDSVRFNLYSKGDGTFVGVSTLNVHEYINELDSFTLDVSVDTFNFADNTTFIHSNLAPTIKIDATGKVYEEPAIMTEEELIELVENASPRELKDLNSWTNPEPMVEEIEAITFKGDVVVDRSESEVYTANFSENGMSVSTVITTPISTYIECAAPEGVILTVKDNFGNELRTLNKITNGYGELFTLPLIEGTSSLVFEFYPRSDSTDITSFELPVNGGYITKEEYDTEFSFTTNFERYDESEFTYIPDIRHYFDEEYTDIMDGDVVVSLGETITLDLPEYEQETGEDSGEQDVTLTNFQVFDSVSKAGIELKDTLSETDTVEGAKFVTVDVNIKNYGAIGNVYEGVGDNTFYIGSYVYATLKEVNEESQAQSIYSEIEYFNHPNNTVSGYYMFNMDKDGEFDGKVGFFYSEELLKNGNIQFAIESLEYISTEEGYTSYKYIYDIPKELIDSFLK